jgi:uncharacterized protein YecE (DUF72 family)
VQLPPNRKKDVARLDAFLALVPEPNQVAFEFRHESWFGDDVFETLRARRAALCIAHTEELETPFIATAGWGYLRLRRVDYDDAALTHWIERTRGVDWSRVFVFFKHEDAGTGPKLAARFRELFEKTTAG